MLAESTSAKYSLEKDTFETENFINKIRDLTLPQVPYYKKTQKKTRKSITEKTSLKQMKQIKDIRKPPPELRSYFLESIDLSAFENKGFSKGGLQELLKGLECLISLRKLLLKKNGITDECSLEIAELIKNKKVQYLNLSCNKLGKASGQAIGQALTSTSHLIWFEYELFA